MLTENSHFPYECMACDRLKHACPAEPFYEFTQKVVVMDWNGECNGLVLGICFRLAHSFL